MLNLIPLKQTELFSSQKAYVSYTFLDHAFKYAAIPVTKELRSICQVIPKNDVKDEFCQLNLSVVQYSNLSSLDGLLRSVPIDSFAKKTDISILDNIVDAKTMNISLVLRKSSDVQKWKHDDTLIEKVHIILQLYVVLGSCLIILPQSKSDHGEIAYICIHATSGKRLPSRIAPCTELKIEEVMSLNKFTCLCSGESQKVIGFSNQMQFLNSIYTANLAAKMLHRLSTTKCIQKLLIIGPAGCGKTSLIRAFTKKKKCGFMKIEASELMHSTPGVSEQKLRELFDEALQHSQAGVDDICVVHLKQIDNICRKSKSVTSHLRRISSQLFQILETIDDSPGIIVVATTNDVHSLNPALRRASRLQMELHVGTPDEKERQEIIKLHNSTLKPSICKQIAACTPGFNGADLRLLSHNVNRINRDTQKRPRSDSEILQMFEQSIQKHRPSSMRSGLGVVQMGNVDVNHLGGLEKVKDSLRSYIEWPLKHPEAFERLGIPIPKGILLYGPPGCAKTSLACAVATAMSTNFLAVSAAELYSPYVGEAEKNVVELFHKARVNSPCILFVDEIDTLVGNRSSTSKNVQAQVLSAFLTEMDGVGNKLDWSTTSKQLSKAPNTEKKRINSILVIAATNRPNKLDSALLRPGRFDKLIYVGPPNTHDRLDILYAVTSRFKMPLSNCVDLTEIAEKTELFSGADLTNLMKEAGYMALFENMTSVQIKQEHIVKSLSSVQPSLKTDTSEYYRL